MDPDRNPQPPEVTTEPQRQALDDMSRQLVERLNDMVREQNERAERFAATQHSLSHLPGQQQEAAEPPGAPQALPTAPVVTEVLPEATPEFAAQPAQQPKKKQNKIAIPQLFPSKPKEPQTFDNKPLWEAARPKWPSKNSGSDAKKAEESGCGTFPTIVAIIIIVIILRACS